MKRSVRQHLALTVGTLLLASVTAACGSEPAATVVDGPWEDVIAAARDEGRVNYYSVLDDDENARLAAAFEAKYPDIKVNVTRGAGELPARVESEIRADADGADVFVMSDPSWFSKSKDSLLEVNGPSVEGWHDDGWVAPDRAVYQSAYPFSMLVWNTDKFPNGFETWDDLIKPEVKGQLALRSDVTVSFAGFLEFQEDKLGSDYLKSTAAMDPKFYPSIVPMTQAVASGEVGVTNASTPSAVHKLQEQGAPIAATVPSPSYWIQRGAAAIATSKRPNAARVFLDFLMSEEGQQISNGDGRGKAARDGVEGILEADNITMLDSTRFTPEVVAEYDAKFNEYFS